LLAEAEAASDCQLALARALLAACRSPDLAEELTSWLTGEHVPAGLVIDRPLRWNLVLHLARLGRLDDAAIATEEAADCTIAGVEQAAAARAAQPRAEAKEAAWHLAVASDQVTNEAHRAICRAFWQREQDEILAPYADRYLEAVADISAGRGVWAVNSPVLRTTAVRDLFPQLRAPQPFLTRLDAWLEEQDLADYIRRLIAERRDDVLRAVRCQQADQPDGQ
jgi:aminopeptidase N